jgi:hypothetical protein
MGMQATRIQVSGAITNFSDVYGDPLSRWEVEVWCKPLLLYPGRSCEYMTHVHQQSTVTCDPPPPPARPVPLKGCLLLQTHRRTALRWA